MTKLAEVVTFPNENAGNIAAMLRQAANSLEAETEADDRTECIIAVQLCESGGVKVYGWGRTDSVRAIGTLHLGIADIVGNQP
jgi:hypothetical protein